MRRITLTANRPLPAANCLSLTGDDCWHGRGGQGEARHGGAGDVVADQGEERDAAAVLQPAVTRTQGTRQLPRPLQPERASPCAEERVCRPRRQTQDPQAEGHREGFANGGTGLQTGPRVMLRYGGVVTLRYGGVVTL
eukprot:1178392-Prorocentrum_minimum.AAC.2